MPPNLITEMSTRGRMRTSESVSTNSALCRKRGMRFNARPAQIGEIVSGEYAIGRCCLLDDCALSKAFTLCWCGELGADVSIGEVRHSCPASYRL